MTTLPSFSDVSNALITLSSLGSAGESHGLLCALLTFNNKIRESAWVDSLLASHIETNDAESQKAYQLLMNLFKNTAQAFLDAKDFDMPILLPEDNLSLEERIDGLAEWCQGYLTGLHLMGIKLEGNDNPDIQEPLDDLVAISQVEFTPEDEKDPQSEVSFMELVEHVKVAVLTIQGGLKENLSHRDDKTTLH